MSQKVKVTAAVATVLGSLMESPDADHYGLELMKSTGLPSGTLYPILVRLQRAEWLEACWEDVDASQAGRPARKYYRLTPDGTVAARRELTAMYQRLSRLPGIAQEGSPA
ncbi:PadR family transcriptional regulator [Stackebrandtia nassauensis]|uniref:Transcriptional regulator, PadR-like family n=1 Tax=Stackebrandtia nassauensis (strain DSM 44728 / CIP 108903 / NRRL B-16338 / NBRC 102104 / LLR-40K-21) TaxID=446470 RepID=D3PVC7_STANL|nr:helix-turn-helix transcriptional regulator [Stackebrandtia nassauensis]ADD41180.1 transcriptional regulator, PadR-like family [Stackebrandtia nassauensis DSM 44728]